MEYGKCQDTVNTTEASLHHFSPGYCKKIGRGVFLPGFIVSLLAWVFPCLSLHRHLRSEIRTCSLVSPLGWPSLTAATAPSPRVVSPEHPLPECHQPRARHLARPAPADRSKGGSWTLTVTRNGDKSPHLGNIR